MAALVTAGAHLVLALIERMVSDVGGSHAFCDTDSMAIVATETGGLVPCEGGEHQLLDGRAAIRALSWAEVDAIVAELEPLNPYRRDVVPGSLLEIDDVNFDAETGGRRQLWCVCIAAKRYALFTRDSSEPTIVPGTTRHGLGFLIDPRDPLGDGVKQLAPWEHTLWVEIVRELFGLSFDAPPWHDRPAEMRHTVSSPHLLKAFQRLNRSKPYAGQIKPFNFMLAVPVEAQERPDGLAADAPLTLAAPYEANPRRWALRSWYDVYSGDTYRITTRMPGGGPGTVGVKALGTVARAYPFHAEAKRCGPDGHLCGKRTSGMLRRRPVHAAGQMCIGKEAHKLEERDLAAGIEELQTVFADPRREPWTTVVLPRLRQLASHHESRTAMMEASGLKARALRDILSGRSRSRAATRAALAALAQGAPISAERRCNGCGEPIALPDPRRRYCSSSCKLHGRQRRPRRSAHKR